MSDQDMRGKHETQTTDLVIPSSQPVPEQTKGLTKPAQLKQ